MDRLTMIINDAIKEIELASEVLDDNAPLEETEESIEYCVAMNLKGVAKKVWQMGDELAAFYQKQADGLLVELTVCDWHRIEEDWNVWQCSACGLEWALDDGTPFENNMYYCPKCGANIKTITERYFDYVKYEYVMETLTREEAEKALESEVAND